MRNAQPQTLPEPTLPHQPALEPKDETIAELQAFVCQSRQLDESLGYAELVMAASDNLRRLCEHPDPQYAVAVAALCLRLREEHL